MKKLLILIALIAQLTAISHAQYVSIGGDGKFKLNGQNFYPLVCNYGVQIIKNSSGNIWATPDHNYSNSNCWECNSKTECLNIIKAHFQMIKDMGFNCVRLCGLSPGGNNGGFTMDGTLSDDVSTWPPKPQFHDNLASPYTPMFTLISDVLSIAADRGIKIILLAGGPDAKSNRGLYAAYLASLSNYFKDNTALMAYDLDNEPLYSSSMVLNKDNENLTKSQMACIVTGWINGMKNNDPNHHHLITIGFTTSSEVFGWDPASIPVDFASFHPYPSFTDALTNEVTNEMYWYSKNITPKPWIIGETSFLSGNKGTDRLDNVQKQYADSTLKRCVNCGGQGYSWWQYHDVYWGDGSDLDGLLANDSAGVTTHTSDPALIVQGTLKSGTASEFQTFHSYVPTNSCPMNSDYYNSDHNAGNAITGTITDLNNNPISGAVIKGQTASWGGDTYTFSDLNGNFKLYSQSNSDYIRVLYYSYLNYEKTDSYLPGIVSTSSITLPTTIINITDAPYVSNNNSATKVNVNNFWVKGNGASGGSATINAPFVQFNSGTKVDKGGYLYAGPKNIPLVSNLTLSPMSICGSSKSDEFIDEPLSIVDQNKLNQNINVYPNPSTGVLNIQSNMNQTKFVELYDTYGRRVYSTTSNDQLISVNISAIPKGVYLLRINTNNNTVFKKIILQ